MRVPSWKESHWRLQDLGEKRIIREIIRPLFNPTAGRWGVGDDCALVAVPPDRAMLVSTDRVPADLIAFRAGILNYRGLGAYLVNLNLSDIAACGGTAHSLLLNLGLPRHLLVGDLWDLLDGARGAAAASQAEIVGGDMSDSLELSISATAIGSVVQSAALSRQSARPGDVLFFSRPMGLTPAAFLQIKSASWRLQDQRMKVLSQQFTHCGPMFALANELVCSGRCTSCMDNTDGLGQCLQELSEYSAVRIVLDARRCIVPELVAEIASAHDVDALQLALSPGADFSLVGTLSPGTLPTALSQQLQMVGHVEAGSGVLLESGECRTELKVPGWSYYH